MLATWRRLVKRFRNLIRYMRGTAAAVGTDSLGESPEQRAIPLPQTRLILSVLNICFATDQLFLHTVPEPEARSGL